MKLRYHFLMGAALAIVVLVAAFKVSGLWYDQTSDGTIADCFAASAPPEPFDATDNSIGPPATNLPVTVARVINGDTIEGKINYVLGETHWERIRPIGYDSPEVNRGSAAERKRGVKATEALRSMLAEGGDVYLRVDPSGRSRDNFGRVLGRLLIYRPGAPDREERLIDVAKVMISAGHVKGDR